MKKILFLTLILFLLICGRSTFAVEMKSDEYQLEIEDIQEPTPVANDPILEESTSTVQTKKSQFDTLGYSIQTNLNQSPFELNLKTSTITFKNLHEEPEQIKEVLINPISQADYGYQLFVKQDIPMRTRFKNEIAQTKCSGNEKPCTEKFAQEWISKSEYGIGYYVAGAGASLDFVNEDYYRPFSKNDYIQIYSSPLHQENNEATLKIKMNTQSTQQESSYQGMISILALPTL